MAAERKVQGSGSVEEMLPMLAVCEQASVAGGGVGRRVHGRNERVRIIAADTLTVDIWDTDRDRDRDRDKNRETIGAKFLLNR